MRFHPAYLAFCRDWGVQPRACATYRVRTKGKTEAGVKYVERNAPVWRAFASFTALEQHLTMHLSEQLCEIAHLRGISGVIVAAQIASARRASLFGC